MANGQAVDLIYFPMAAVIANVIRYADGRAAAVATVSRNGVTGLAAFMTEEPLAWDLCVQIAGQAWQLPADVFRAQCRQSPALMKLLLGLTHDNQIEASINAACYLRHGLKSRIARWLLTTQERTRISVLPVTQEDLADWTGAQRTSVAECTGALAKLGATKTSRGQITVVNRDLLKTVACECYGKLSPNRHQS